MQSIVDGAKGHADPRGTIGGVRTSRIPFFLARPRLVLPLLVCTATAIRGLVSWHHPTPVFFPDELIYSGLARGVAETGRPVYLGQSLELPAVLTSYLTAPFWLLSDTTLAYHLVQSAGGLAFSLAAIPAYLLGRRLRLSTGASLLVAAGTLVLPDLVLSSLLLSEPFAFTLFLFTYWAGHRALLSVQSVRRQLLFLGLLLLLCLTRTQFIILPAAYLLALLGQGLLERRSREMLRAQFVVLGAFALPIPIAAAVGFTRVFGFYSSIADYLTPSPGAFAHWLALNLLVLGISCGWLLAPGALIGLDAALRRPDGPEERAFALLLVPVLLGQLIQATVIAVQVRDAQGRYLIYVLPLLLLSFAQAARRGLLLRWPYALGLLALVPIAMVSPIFELNRASLNSAPILLSRHYLEDLVGVPDTYASIPFLLAGLALAALFAWWKRSLPALVGLVAFLFAAASISGSAGQRLLALDKLTPSHAPFLSRAGIERAAFLVGPSSDRERRLSVVFWNREITHVVSLTRIADGPLPVSKATTAADGTLLIDGVPYTGSLLVDRVALDASVRGTEPSTPRNDLFPGRDGTPVQLRTLVTGLVGSAIGSSGSIHAWPRHARGFLRGTVTFSLAVPRTSRDASVIDFRLPGGLRKTIVVEPGRTVEVRLEIRSRGSWTAFFAGSGSGFRTGAGTAIATAHDLRFRFADDLGEQSRSTGDADR